MSEQSNMAQDNFKFRMYLILTLIFFIDIAVVFLYILLPHINSPKNLWEEKELQLAMLMNKKQMICFCFMLVEMLSIIWYLLKQSSEHVLRYIVFIFIEFAILFFAVNYATGAIFSSFLGVISN